jgi:MerC mercury resistance protein
MADRTGEEWAESIGKRLFACGEPWGKAENLHRCYIVTCLAIAYVASAMTELTLRRPRLDMMAMGLSGLCLVHCVATAVLLGFLSAAGSYLGAPIIHEVGLSLAMLLGAFALGRGMRAHGFILPSAVGVTGLCTMAYAMTLHENGYEPLVTMLGVSVLALGHRLNVMATEHGF